ncbi:unnamed protein product, partial [Choristocarpus tenellus]
LTGPIPEVLGSLPALTELDLSSNELSGTIPEALGNLPVLAKLSLFNNQLSDFSKEAALRFQACKDLRFTDFSSNNWVNPPADVVEGGLEAIVRYHEAIERSGSIKSYRLKVVLVGEVCAGKTSLARSMMAGKPDLAGADHRTRGVDIHPWKPNLDEVLELVLWDTGAHKEYDSMRPFLLTWGALYLLVVDLYILSQSESDRGLSVYRWLDALLCRVPGCSVLVVGTHIDLMGGEDEVKDAVSELECLIGQHLKSKGAEMDRVVSKQQQEWSEGKMGEIQPVADLHILGVMSVSCYTGDRLGAVREKIVDLVMREQSPGSEKNRHFPSVGQVIPMSWARASAVMVALRDGLDP